MRFPGIHWIIALIGAIGVSQLAGCCTSGVCLDSQSTKDSDRVYARQYKLGLVVNDSVSSPDRDRTDWRYVDLSQPGKLAAELHWDNTRSQLELAVFDVMGIKIQDGRSWSKGGLRALVAVEKKTRFYVRVRARGTDDESQYSLRLRFKPDQPKVKTACHGCVPGERKCLGNEGYIICKPISPDCTAWTKVTACPAGVICQNGICGGCADPCPEEGKRKCAGPKEFQVCETTAGGCTSWSQAKPCPEGKACRRGRCASRGRTRPPVVETPVVKPPKPATGHVRARIISIYRYRGRMTLHIKIGDNPQIKVGQVGTVLNGETNNPLPGGQIKISKVSGQYAIATTTLEQLGKNHWVRIDLR